MQPDWAAKPTDVPYANFGNPQSLNLFSYVQNNPTTMGDPDGHDIDCPTCDAVWADIKQMVEEGAREGKEMIESARPTGGAAGRILGGAAAIYLTVMISPHTTVGQSAADEMAEKQRLDKENAQKEKAEPEPKTETGSGGNTRQEEEE